MSNVYLKDPDAVLDYSNDWSSYLAAAETISSSTWTSEGGDSALLQPGGYSLNQGASGTISGAITTSCMVSAGTKGQVYALRNRIVTNQGRTDDRVHTIRVEPR